MSLEALREMFQRPPLPPEVPTDDQPLVQPTVKDTRGTLIKIRADKNGPEVKAELWEVAQDLGWPPGVELRAELRPDRSRALQADGWTLSDGKHRKDIFIISSDHIAITYCVPSHPDLVEPQSFMGLDFGTGGRITATIVTRHADGTVVAEQTLTESASKIIEVATAMGVTVEEAARAFRAASDVASGPIGSELDFLAALKEVERGKAR